MPAMASASLAGVGSFGALHRAVVRVLELLQHGHLVAPRVDEDGGVLGGRDVPLQALVDQQVLELVTGGDDVRVDLSTPIFACATLPWSVTTIQFSP